MDYHSRLYTPPLNLPSSSAICVKFDYYISGSYMYAGDLTVNGSSNVAKVFQPSQHQSNTWLPARVTLRYFVPLSQVYVGDFVMISYEQQAHVWY